MIRWSALGLGMVLLLMGPMVAPLKCGRDPQRRARETHRAANARVVEPGSARRAK